MFTHGRVSISENEHVHLAIECAMNPVSFYAQSAAYNGAER